MNLTLIRYYSPTEVSGYLWAEDVWSCCTIEQPWRRGKYPGGRPFESCIPEGDYELRAYTRQRNGDKSFAIVNEELGVYFAEADRPVVHGARRGRFKCLIHGRANYVGDVEGCAAVGAERLISKTRAEVMVTKSVATMNQLLEVVPWEDGHTLAIVKYPGAIDIPLALLPERTA